MRQYSKYVWYVLRHKWFVTIECFKSGIIWRGLKHDIDKFGLRHIIAYANYFYDKHGNKKQILDSTGYYKPTNTGDNRFDYEWFKHTRRNDHHWQYWVLAADDGNEKLVKMGTNAIKEMVCDWIGAGKAQGAVCKSRKVPDTIGWWLQNNSKMRFNPISKSSIQTYLLKMMLQRRIIENPRFSEI